MSIRDQTAVVGIGATPYYRRGRSAPRTLNELVGTAIISAIDDAGMEMSDIDGFAYFGGGFDTGSLCETLGIPEVGFTATLTGSGGGSAGCVGLAAAAIVGMGEAEAVSDLPEQVDEAASADLHGAREAEGIPAVGFPVEDADAVDVVLRRYVDARDGDDRNDGRSPRTAWRPAARGRPTGTTG